MKISQPITVPQTAVTNERTRLRVVYTDGWRPTSYTDNGFDPVDKGRLYDFDIILRSPSIVTGVKNNIFSVSPNPFKGSIQVNFNQSCEYKLNVLSLTGSTLLSKNLTISNGSPYELNTENLQPNVYLLQVTDEKGNTSISKIIKL